MKRPALFLAGLLMPVLLLSGVVHADVNDFTVTDFHADETLSDADPQGILHVVETIQVSYTDFNHGILRAIPDMYKGSPLEFHLNHVSSLSGAPTNVSQSRSNSNVVLKIGDPNRTVTGAQSYTLDYTLHNVISFHTGKAPELYWDVNGDQWSQPFSRVSVSLHTPPGSMLLDPAPRCFAGSYGNPDVACTINSSEQGLEASTQDLAPGQTLTYVAAFHDSNFHAATVGERIRDFLPLATAVILPPFFVGLICLAWWLKRGRDARGRGTVVPRYGPPAGVSPLAAGTIADFKVDNRDITATIIDLARRGYMTIIENRKDRMVLPDKVAYSLKRDKTDHEGLDSFEQQIMNALFDVQPLGSVVELSKLKNEFSDTADSIRKKLSKQLVTDGYFRSDPNKYALSFGLVVYIVAWFAGFVLLGTMHLGFGLVVGLVLAAVVLVLCVRAMPARTRLGTDTKEQLLGLKMYMDTAEKDRMAMLEAPNAPYANGAGAPQRTVELFEKLLPYAIALGVEKQWAAEFNDIYTQPPTWYSGNVTGFNAGYLAGSIGSGLTQSVNASFSAPSSSGGSGFGGGGFSGGGGGGGGGGGW